MEKIVLNDEEKKRLLTKGRKNLIASIGTLIVFVLLYLFGSRGIEFLVGTEIPAYIADKIVVLNFFSKISPFLIVLGVAWMIYCICVSMVMKRKVEKGEIEGYETLIKEQWKYKKYYIRVDGVSEKFELKKKEYYKIGTGDFVHLAKVWGDYYVVGLYKYWDLREEK